MKTTHSFQAFSLSIFKMVQKKTLAMVCDSSGVLTGPEKLYDHTRWLLDVVFLMKAVTTKRFFSASIH